MNIHEVEKDPQRKFAPKKRPRKYKKDGKIHIRQRTGLSTDLGEEIGKRLQEFGVKTPATAAYICQLTNNAIEAVIGPAATKKLKAITYKRNAVTIHAASSVWSQEASARSAQILVHVNKKAPDGKHVERLRFVTGPHERTQAEDSPNS